VVDQRARGDAKKKVAASSRTQAESTIVAREVSRRMDLTRDLNHSASLSGALQGPAAPPPSLANTQNSVF
jgi:hypothetical protein